VTAREVLNFKVRCDNAPLGCAWVGELRHLKKHMDNSCHFNTVTNNTKLLEQLLKRVEHIESTSQPNTTDKKLEQLMKRIETCEKELRKKDQQMIVLNNGLRNKDQMIASFERDLKEKDSKIDNIEKELLKRDERILMLENRVDYLESDRSRNRRCSGDLHKRFENLSASTSSPCGAQQKNKTTKSGNKSANHISTNVGNGFGGPMNKASIGQHIPARVSDNGLGVKTNKLGNTGCGQYIDNNEWRGPRGRGWGVGISSPVQLCRPQQNGNNGVGGGFGPDSEDEDLFADSDIDDPDCP